MLVGLLWICPPSCFGDRYVRAASRRRKQQPHPPHGGLRVRTAACVAQLSSSRTRPAISKAVVGKLKEALQKSAKPERKEQAKSWKVFKSPDPAAAQRALRVVIRSVGQGCGLTRCRTSSPSVPAGAGGRAVTNSTPARYASGQNFVNLTLVSRPLEITQNFYVHPV